MKSWIHNVQRLLANKDQYQPRVLQYRGTLLIRNRHPPQDPHRALGMVLL